MALTLIDQIKLALDRDEILCATIMEIYARNSDLLQYLPFINIDKEKLKPINNAICATDFNDEFLALTGGYIDMDVAIKDIKIYWECFNTMIKGLTGALTEMLITGNYLIDDKEINGFQSRCTENQIINNTSNPNGSSLSIVQLDNLIKSVKDPTHLLMNKSMRQKITQNCKELAHYKLDTFGHKIAYYNDLQILIAGLDNFDNEILGFHEKSIDGNKNCTSIYCLSLTDDGVVGLQDAPMKVTDLSELDDRPVSRTRIDWMIGLSVPDKSIARLRYIKDGAVKCD